MISGDNNRVVLLRLDMAEKIGRLEAMLLSQIDYWLEHTHNFADGRFWVYNTESEWGRQLGVSAASVKRAAARLEKQGLILRRRLNGKAYDRTLSYSICYEKLRDLGFRAGRRGFWQLPDKVSVWDRPAEAAETWSEGEDNAWAMEM